MLIIVFLNIVSNLHVAHKYFFKLKLFYVLPIKTILEGDLNHLVHSPDGHQWPGPGHAEARSFIPISHIGEDDRGFSQVVGSGRAGT